MSESIIDLQEYKDRNDAQSPALSLVKKDKTSLPAANPSRVKAQKIVLSVFILLFVFLTILAAGIFGNDNYYTIKKGENAYTVASKFNVPLDILLKLNEMTGTFQMEEGARIKIPTVHDVHHVVSGDTPYSIARQYGIKRHELVKYNRLVGHASAGRTSAGHNYLKEGDRIFIPRILSDIQISSSRKTGLVPFEIQFSVDTNTRDRIRAYRWTLGDGNTSANRSPSFAYEQKGTYYVSLTVADENGNEVTSNTITVVARSLAHIGFNARTYVTGNKNDLFSLNTRAIDNLNNTIDFDYEINITQNPKLLLQIGRTDEFEIVGIGYSKITFEVKGYKHTSYFFVSPIPSKHVPGPDVEWYKTQYGTGLNGNCGPASVAMGIYWAKGTNIPVRTVRSQIGMPSEDGAVGFSHMITIFERHKVRVKTKVVKSPANIRSEIDSGNLVLLLFHSGSIEQTKRDPRNSFYNRYYSDSVGHYIIIKGYTENKEYFIAYDPIPGDWYRNLLRYADGVSMIGKNRFYSAKEVFSALKTRALLVISKS